MIKSRKLEEEKKYLAEEINAAFSKLEKMAARSEKVKKKVDQIASQIRELNKNKHQSEKIYFWESEHLSEEGIYLSDLPKLRYDLIGWFVAQTNKNHLKSNDSHRVTLINLSNGGCLFASQKDCLVALNVKQASELNQYLQKKNWGEKEFFRFQDCPAFVSIDKDEPEFYKSIIFTPRSWSLLSEWKKKERINFYKKYKMIFSPRIDREKNIHDNGPLVIRETA